MKKYLFMAVALAAIVFVPQKASAQINLELTSSVSSIDLGTVEVNTEVPIGFIVGMVDTGNYIPPYIVGIQIKSEQNKVEVRNVVYERLGIPTWNLYATVEPIVTGSLAGEALEVSVEVPIPLLPNITLTTEIPVTGTVVP